MKKTIQFCILASLFLILGACKTTQKNKTGKTIKIKTPETVISQEKAIQSPKLAVIISIDQMRYDYLERFDTQFTGGFRRLLDEGAVMQKANYGHAVTGTAPGHATISTGCHPAKHGIVANHFYIQKTGNVVYAVDDENTTFVGVDKEGAAASPHQLKVPALGDWLKAVSPASKVYGVAVKDRSSILMAGQNANRAFWFDKKSTQMVSSDYYQDAFPTWTSEYVGKELFKKELEKGWHKLKDEAVYANDRADNFEYEISIQRPTFPHTLNTFMPPASQSSTEIKKGLLMAITPFGDAYALEYAKGIIKHENLGKDATPDVLMVSCSIADKIGHHFGPFSQEAHDYYLRLDQYLGDFFTYLDKEIGKDNYYVALSADHGVIPIPESLVEKGIDAKRITKKQLREDVTTIENQVKAKLGLKKDFVNHIGKEGVALDYTEIETKGLSKAEFRATVAIALKTLSYVEEVFTPEDYFASHPKKDVSFFVNSYREDRGVELRLKFHKYTLGNAGINGTSHGSVYDYDTHIPVIFMGGDIRAGKYKQAVGVVDIAPTMARILNVEIPTHVDGQVLDFVLK